jgi:adenylate cyclase
LGNFNTIRIDRWTQQYSKQIDIALLILGFTLGANYFALLRISGFREIGIDFSATYYDVHWSSPTLTGLLIGTSISLLEFRVFPRLLRGIRQPYRVLIRAAVSSLTIVANAALLYTVTDLLTHRYSFAYAAQQAGLFIISPTFITLFIFLILLGITLSFLRAVGNRFGHGILINYLLGKYREPIEEYRIFMFIDLNKSTSIAEQLGHVRYSRFLNKCFSDLSSLLTRYDAEVYQYVGDEAVVTWNMHYLKNQVQPIFLFFAFEELLRKQRAMYQEKFGVVPTFKAALNAGAVVVTELGTHRRELVYHGDVLNTASRVLELGSRTQKKLLVTSHLYPMLEGQEGFNVHYVSDLTLRGKSDRTTVYEVVPHTEESNRYSSGALPTVTG